MPRIAAVSTANPTHIFTQEEIKEFAKSLYGEDELFTRLLPVFDNVKVQKRHLTADLEWFRTKHSFTETNELYIKTALELSEGVAIDVANQCGISTNDFDVIFFISTTGLSTPSIDAHLFNRISLNPHIKRIPIWGLGCAGGAAGLARAYDYLMAYPRHRALIIAVELCSLSFQINELNKTNIVSAALFADGAAACAVFGDLVPTQERPYADSHPSLLGSLSTIYPDSLDIMRWQATTDGFKVRLSQNIPSIVTSLVKCNIEEFLCELKLSLSQIDHFIFHPGGTKVLQAYAEGLNLPIDKLAHSFNVLCNFGNMSSVTVFFVLKRFLENMKQNSREYGLIGSLGPGFSSELVILRWD
jgi:alkylresorcinol/alkylpyrone synthase